MILHNVEFDFNPLKGTDAERLDKANAELQAAKSGTPTNKGLAETVRYQCAVIDRVLAGLLGNDYARKLGADTDDLSALSALLKDFFEAVTEQTKTLKNGLTNAQPKNVMYQPHGQGKRRRHK